MSTLLLICVFGVSAHSSGVIKTHSLTPLELSRYIAVDQSSDDESDESNDQHHALERAMCRASFGATPDLNWVESRAALSAVRS